MKDIGSIFPLYEEDWSRFSQKSHELSDYNQIFRYSLCREALYAIAEEYADTNKVVIIPAYTCQTVIDPFIQQGWTCHFYNIKKNLRIDIDHLNKLYEDYHPALIVVHPYLGMELNEDELQVLSSLKQEGCVLIEDLTQCILTSSRPKIFDYFVGSYRKWIKIPDGGFLEIRKNSNIERPTQDSIDFIRKQTDAMYLRGLYFITGNEILKEISIRLNKDAVKAAGKIEKLYKMSDFSSIMWEKEDLKAVEISRLGNYIYLFETIKNTNRIESVCKDISEITTAPLYFPIYVKGRSDLQKILAENHIYAPVLWPVYDEGVLINENIKYIYDSILMIPIDQRYDKEDMSRITQIINSYA